MQGPPAELNQSDRELALEVFEQSLKYFHNTFPETRLITAYIPSPLTCYEILGRQPRFRPIEVSELFSLLAS